MAEDHGPVIIVTGKAQWDQLHKENADSVIVVSCVIRSALADISISVVSMQMA